MLVGISAYKNEKKKQKNKRNLPKAGRKPAVGRFVCEEEEIGMNIVLIVAWILAFVSALVIPPDRAYLGYIDFHTLGLLFCLMAVMAGANRLGVFRQAADKLLSFVKNSRQLDLILVFICFVSSMLITNDVALITFVPFAIQVLQMSGRRESIVSVVVLQTIAANLGSMFTPIGNPQNLYLYSQSGMGVGEFLVLMLPYTVLAAVLLFSVIIVRKKQPLSPLKVDSEISLKKYRKRAIYAVLFVLCLLCVAQIVSVWLVTFVTILVVFFTDRDTLKEIDYSLLLTFAGFFIFIGNMGRIPAFCDFLKEIISGNEVLTAVASSQVISNVPAALLLSGFTDKWEALIIGTNIGGLGTLIASMASLISYRFIVASGPKEKGKYVVRFTIANLLFLAVFIMAAFIF